MADAGYARSFTELMESTAWEQYGTGRNPKCANCMMHCGYEPTAVNDTFAHPLKALKIYLSGPRTAGPMAPDPLQYRAATDGDSQVEVAFGDRSPRRG